MRTTIAAFMTALIWAQSYSPALAGDAPPTFRGNMGFFVVRLPQKLAPAAEFFAADGTALDFSQFRGKVVLVNFWATWCAPCVQEMPSLDRLQARLGGQGLQVVALSIDRSGLGIVELFYRKLGLKRLAMYSDPKRAVYKAFGVRALPTSFVIDRAGRLAGYLYGPAAWDTPAARALLRYYIGAAAQHAERR